MAQDTKRPKAPHLFTGPFKLHYSWGAHMTVSIINRLMGSALATLGVAGFVWWLIALASGPEVYASFHKCASSWFGLAVMAALTFAFFLHLLAGIRHFVLDAGAGFELVANRKWAWATMIGAVLLTGLYWLAFYLKGAF